MAGASDRSQIIKRTKLVQPTEEPTGKRSRLVLEPQNEFEGWQSNAGMVTRVWMKNFMCHGELDYRPTERLNFLHGANGSGKSAVLSAIVFALGGNARISNRGAANKGIYL